MDNLSNLVADSLTAGESFVLGKLFSEEKITQRKIAEESSFSTGMVNIIVKNLVQKGYLKILRLNRKNIKYLLTVKGLAEHYQLTCLYIRDTFKRLDIYKRWVGELIDNKIKDGFGQFIVIGKDELTEIVVDVLNGYKDISYVKIGKAEDVSSTSMIILDCEEKIPLTKTDYSNNERYINVIEYISKKL